MAVFRRVLVDHCRDGLAAGEAELHDVGKLAVRIVNRIVIGDYKSFQCVSYTIKFNQTTRTSFSLGGEHFYTLRLGGSSLLEYCLNI